MELPKACFLVVLIFWATFGSRCAAMENIRVVPERIRGQDGTLSLLVAVPLTRDNEPTLDPGWFQMAAALLAVDHFNGRNGSVVPELARLGGPPSFCNLTFTVSVVDTGTDLHLASDYLVDQLRRNRSTDAIAGPYHELPALELSVLATALQSPVLSLRANLLSEPQRHHPYFHLMSADSNAEMQFVSRYLSWTNRTNYIAVLYGSNSAAEIQKVDLLRSILHRDGFARVRTFAYKLGDEYSDYLSPLAALQAIKKTGYRTIVVLPDNLHTDAPAIDQAASALGLDRGQHLWVLSGGIHRQSSTSETIQFLRQAQKNQYSFLRGSAFLYPTDDSDEVDFTKVHLERQNQTFFQRVQAHNPIRNFFGNSMNYSQEAFPIRTIARHTRSWMQGSSYMYDAVVSIGLGACRARQPLTGPLHVEGIRSTVFMGASGKVQYGNHKSPGSRTADTVIFGIVNLLPPRVLPGGHPMDPQDGLFRQVAQYNPLTQEWIPLGDMVYADGSHFPPTLLRDEPESNYLDPLFRAIGLALMAVGLLLVGLSALWVFLHRHHTVVVAAQPAFLYTLLLGAAMVVSVVWITSFDESYGWTQPQLSRACVVSVWIDALGHMLAFSALFTKLWRVNRCMRYKTAQVAVWRVLWPSALLFTLVVVLLSLWTALGSFVWVRKVIDETTGESIGRCEGDHADLWIAPIYILHFVPTVLAGIMAYKTSGMDDLYSEAKWVLTFILVQVQVLIVGVPVVLILQDVTSNARFLGYSLLVFTFPVTTAGLIVLPKVLTVRRMTKRASESAPRSNNNTQEAERDETARHVPRVQIVTFD